MLGSGIIKGMGETARNFFGSYTDAERLVTVEYPEERLAPAAAARNFPFLVYDGDDPMAGLRCVACQICEKECPPQCIYIIKDPVKKPDYMGKMQVQPKVFDIDISVCMSCQICVEVCPFEAIKMDTTYELSNTGRFAALLLSKEQLAKPNEYYLKIHPAEASEVDARLAAEKSKGEAKAKAAPAASMAAAPTRGPVAAPATPKAPDQSAAGASETGKPSPLMDAVIKSPTPIV
jgi:NADH-quinone oxidoreductase subunit I